MGSISARRSVQSVFTWGFLEVATLLVPLFSAAALSGQTGSEPPPAAPTGEEVRMAAGLSAAAVRFSGESWPRVGVWAEVRALPAVAVWGEAWGVRRSTVLCSGGVSSPQCDHTSDGVGWLLGARLFKRLGPGEGWAGMGVGRSRYDHPTGRTRSKNIHFMTGYRVTLGDRLVLSPRIGVDLFLGETAVGGWNHLGVEAGVRF